MVYLDKIPDHAIIFEAVEIAKKRGHKGIPHGKWCTTKYSAKRCSFIRRNQR